MAFSPQFLDELRARAGLAETVGRRVQLTRRGREHIGLCPFHNEKTPSFTVNEEKGFYHCFGCGAHGSVIDFVMNTDGLSFPEAVERLAAQAGMEVPVDSPAERERARRAKGLYDVLEAAVAEFERRLRLPEGRGAMAYLKDRGLGEATIKTFRIGFAPDGGALKAALAREGVSEDKMIEAGLVIQPDDPARASYDRFRRRIMFPITDRRGRVIAFGGRILGEGEPKYLNSPETPVFHKGRTLYGLAEAAQAVRQNARIIVAEGYMDVIALHQAGFEGAVAPLGTALTEDQITLLWRLAREPVLCFDGDAAGARAAARAADRALPLLKPGYTLRFAMLPPGEDPDSLVQSGGAKAMNEVLNSAVSLPGMLWRMETEGRIIDSPDERAWLEDRLVTRARRIADPTVRGHYTTAFKDRLWRELRENRNNGNGRARSRAQLEKKSGSAAKVDMIGLCEAILLATLITHPELFDHVGERLGALELSDRDLDKLRQDVLKTLSGEMGLDSGALRTHLYDHGFEGAVKGILSARVFDHAFFARPAAPTEAALEGWEETLARLRQHRLLAEIREAERRLAEDPSTEALQMLRALKESEAAGRPVSLGTSESSDDAA